jgi:hypothetical protein
MEFLSLIQVPNECLMVLHSSLADMYALFAELTSPGFKHGQYTINELVQDEFQHALKGTFIPRKYV